MEEAAKELAEALRDPRGFRFYAWAIWNALRGYLYGHGPDAMEVLFWAVCRAWGAMAAGSARKPGALVVHLLKEKGFMGYFQQIPAREIA